MQLSVRTETEVDGMDRRVLWQRSLACQCRRCDVLSNRAVTLAFPWRGAGHFSLLWRPASDYSIPAVPTFSVRIFAADFLQGSDPCMQHRGQQLPPAPAACMPAKNARTGQDKPQGTSTNILLKPRSAASSMQASSGSPTWPPACQVHVAAPAGECRPADDMQSRIEIFQSSK